MSRLDRHTIAVKDLARAKKEMHELMPSGGRFFYTVSSSFTENYDDDGKGPAMIKVFGIRAVLQVPGKKDSVVLIEADMYRYREEVTAIAMRRLTRRLSKAKEDEEKALQYAALKAKEDEWKKTLTPQQLQLYGYNFSTDNYYHVQAVQAANNASYSTSSSTPTSAGTDSATSRSNGAEHSEKALEVVERVADIVEKPLSEEEELEKLLAEQEHSFNKQLSKAEKKKAAEEAERKQANAKASRLANRKH